MTWSPGWKISIIFCLAACKFGAATRQHIDRNDFKLHYVGQYFAITNHADAKEGWAKNAIGSFVTKASVDEALAFPEHTLITW